MSGPVVELAKFVVKPEYDVDEVGSAGAKMLLDSFDVVLSQPGCRRAYWSKQFDKPDVVHAFFEWDAIEDHYNFQKSAAYQPMIDSIRPLFAAPPIIKHIRNPSGQVAHLLDLRPSSSHSSNITEFLHIYFDADLSAAQKSSIEATLQEFVEKGLVPMVEKGFGYQGFSYGWTVETDVPFEGNAPEGKGTALVIFAGWESHEKWREMQKDALFRETVGILLGVEGLKGTNLVFVKCQVKEAEK